MGSPFGLLLLKAFRTPSAEKAGWSSPIPLSSVTFVLPPPPEPMTQTSVPLEWEHVTVPLKAGRAPSGDQEGSLLEPRWE